MEKYKTKNTHIQAKNLKIQRIKVHWPISTTALVSVVS